VPLLGSLPLSPAFRAAGDAGVPGILSEPDDPASVELRSIARTLERQGRGLGRRKLPLHLHDTSA
jgi:ATP-binding protein involved in chromosome partitioning